VVALATGSAFPGPRLPRGVLALGACLAVLPDIDAFGYWAGVPYDSLWGHRGITHSLAFAVLVAAGTAAIAFRRDDPSLSRSRLGLFLFVVMVSHGLLDACTNGGLGIAFFAPFDDSRYFFPVRPIEVSPIGIRRFFTARGWVIAGSELRWIWLPSAVLAGSAALVRRIRTDPAPLA